MNEDFKRYMSYFATGITIITTKFKNELFGITVNSFNSVSLNPQMILYSLDRKTERFNVFSSSDEFLVNILSCKQKSLSEDFASNDFKRWRNHFLEDGRVKNAICSIYCMTKHRYDGGDHQIIVANVKDYFLNNNQDKENPLIYYSKKYYSISNEI